MANFLKMDSKFPKIEIAFLEDPFNTMLYQIHSERLQICHKFLAIFSNSS